MSEPATQFGRVPFQPIADGAVATLNLAECRVYIVLAAHCDRALAASPGIGRLSKLAGVHERTAQRALKALVHKGLVGIEPGGGRGKTNAYVLKEKPRQVKAGVCATKPRQSATKTPATESGNPGNLAPKPRRSFAGGTERTAGNTREQRAPAREPAGLVTGALKSEKKKDGERAPQNPPEETENLTFANVTARDLSDLRRLELLRQDAVRRRLIPDSDLDAIRFFAAACRARRVGAAGKGDGIRIFVGIVRKRLWKNLSEADVDAGNAVLKALRDGPPAPRQATRPALPPLPQPTGDPKLDAAMRHGYWRKEHARVGRPLQLGAITAGFLPANKAGGHVFNWVPQGMTQQRITTRCNPVEASARAVNTVECPATPTLRGEKPRFDCRLGTSTMTRIDTEHRPGRGPVVRVR